MKNKNIIYTLTLYPEKLRYDNPHVKSLNQFKEPPKFEDLTVPGIKAYAKEVEADYMNLGDELLTLYPDFTQRFLDAGKGIYKGETSPVFPKGRMMHGFWYKILVLDFFLQSNYDKMLFMDLDILFNRMDYNIFSDMGGADVIAGTTEWMGRLSTAGLAHYCRDLRYNDPPDEDTAKLLDNQKYEFNSGVFAITKAGARKVIDSCLPYSDLQFMPFSHNGDQGFLTYKFLKYCSVKKLAPYIHCVSHHGPTHPESVFLHFCSDGRSENKRHHIQNYLRNNGGPR